MDLENVGKIAKFIDYMQNGFFVWDNVAPVIKLILYLIIFILVLYLFKKIKISGVIITWVFGLTVFARIISLAGFDIEFIEAWLEMVKYLIPLIGIG